MASSSSSTTLKPSQERGGDWRAGHAFRARPWHAVQVTLLEAVVPTPHARLGQGRRVHGAVRGATVRPRKPWTAPPRLPLTCTKQKRSLFVELKQLYVVLYRKFPVLSVCFTEWQMARGVLRKQAKQQQFRDILPDCMARRENCGPHLPARLQYVRRRKSRRPAKIATVEVVDYWVSASDSKQPLPHPRSEGGSGRRTVTGMRYTTTTTTTATTTTTDTNEDTYAPARSYCLPMEGIHQKHERRVAAAAQQRNSRR